MITTLITFVNILGEQYNPTPEHESIDHSSEFNLVKEQSTGYIFCLKKGQTIAQRKVIKER